MTMIALGFLFLAATIGWAMEYHARLFDKPFSKIGCIISMASGGLVAIMLVVRIAGECPQTAPCVDSHELLEAERHHIVVGLLQMTRDDVRKLKEQQHGE